MRSLLCASAVAAQASVAKFIICDSCVRVIAACLYNSFIWFLGYYSLYLNQVPCVTVPSYICFGTVDIYLTR